MAKLVSQAHGADAAGSAFPRKKLGREQLLPVFASQPRCVVVIEACDGAHHSAQELAALGHVPKLIPSPFVKPFGEAPEDDMADVEATC